MEQNAIIQKFTQNSIYTLRPLKKNININLFADSNDLIKNNTQYTSTMDTDIITFYKREKEKDAKKEKNFNNPAQIPKIKGYKTQNDTIDLDAINQILDQPLLKPSANLNQTVKCIDIDWSTCENCVKYFLIINAVEFINIINKLAAPLIMNNYEKFICEQSILNYKATIYFIKQPVIELLPDIDFLYYKNKIKKKHIQNKSSKLTNVQINCSVLH